MREEKSFTTEFTEGTVRAEKNGKRRKWKREKWSRKAYISKP